MSVTSLPTSNQQLGEHTIHHLWPPLVLGMNGERYEENEEQGGLTSAAPAPVTRRLPTGRFRDFRLLARGGMAYVYWTYDTRLGYYVALKLLAPGFSSDPVRVGRFLLEARRAQALHHPHIVPILDYGTHEGQLYIEMPLYPTNLTQVLHWYGLPTLPQLLALVRQLASALDYANRQGLIHRDIKPSNILLDQHSQAALTDFGIAKGTMNAPSSLATSGPLREAELGQSPFFTPGYCAPESLLGEPVDPRTDVFGLAIVVYQLLTGHTPFSGRPLARGTSPAEYSYQFLVRMLTEHPLPPSTLAPQPLPAGLDAVLLKALYRKPADRFATVGDFYDELHRILAPYA